MSLLASYFYSCDNCGTDTGDSRPNIEEAREYAERGGWNLGFGPNRYDLCEDCVQFWGSSDES